MKERKEGWMDKEINDRKKDGWNEKERWMDTLGIDSEMTSCPSNCCYFCFPLTCEQSCPM